MKKKIEGKIYTLIDEMSVNAATFKREKIYPSLINFFYGKNGSGKSTISREIDKKSCFDASKVPSDYEVLVYNEDYIEDNISSYGNISGVFTISKVNKEVNEKIENLEKSIEKIELSKSKDEAGKIKVGKDLKKAEDAYVKSCWAESDDFRLHYPELMEGGKSSRSRYMERLGQSIPSNISKEDVINEYMLAYRGEVKTFDYYSVPAVTFPDSALLSESIISSSNSPFAEFIKALNNSDWVREGHEKYQHGDDCPYCQRRLPENFEEKFAECFDESYNRKVAELKQFKFAYESALSSVRSTIEANLQNQFDYAFKSEYELGVRNIIELINGNLALIDKKIANPATIVVLKSINLSALAPITEKINCLIKENNDKASDTKGAQERCKEMAWGYLTARCQEYKTTYEASSAILQKQLDSLDKSINAYIADIAKIRKQISALNDQHANTDQAMESINSLLKSSGFKGFQLQAKPHAKYVYQLVRLLPSGEYGVVKGKEMSEGERHFLAFLYFYHTVVGTKNDNGTRNNKIVVIDDPVSSMDSSSLFIVASLVRNLASITYNNYKLSMDSPEDYIKQFFCLSHNPYFFREVTYGYIKDFECASLFEIKKDEDNISSVEICIEEEDRVGGGKQNSSPVKDTYDALWLEYRTTKDPVILMNDVRQILEYYFLHVCGYQNLREDILDKHRDAFTDEEYTIASAILNLLTVGVGGFSDGLYFDASAVDMTDIREVLRKFFDVIDQISHFNMMMKKR